MLIRFTDSYPMGDYGPFTNDYNITRGQDSFVAVAKRNMPVDLVPPSRLRYSGAIQLTNTKALEKIRANETKYPHLHITYGNDRVMCKWDGFMFGTYVLMLAAIIDATETANDPLPKDCDAPADIKASLLLNANWNHIDNALSLLNQAVCAGDVSNPALLDEDIAALYITGRLDIDMCDELRHFLKTLVEYADEHEREYDEFLEHHTEEEIMALEEQCTDIIQSVDVEEWWFLGESLLLA